MYEKKLDAVLSSDADSIHVVYGIPKLKKNSCIHASKWLMILNDRGEVKGISINQSR